MAKCPKCNNDLPVFGARETVPSSSGLAKYRVCPQCRAILKPTFNKKMSPLLYLIIFALFMLTQYGSHSTQMNRDLLLFVSVVVVISVLMRFFIEYEPVDNAQINKPITEAPRPQFKDYLRSSGFLIVYALILAQMYFMHLGRYMSPKDKMMILVIGPLLVLGMIWMVNMKQKMKN